MDFKRGVLQAAFIAGVVGAVAGTFFSWSLFNKAMAAKARHQAFDRLANSDVVQEERKILQDWKSKDDALLKQAALQKSAPAPVAADPDTPQSPGLSHSKPRHKAAQSAPVEEPGPDPEINPIGTAVDPGIAYKGTTNALETDIRQAQEDSWRFRMQNDVINRGGIQTIHWADSFAVKSIDTDTGEKLHPEPAPGSRVYLAVAAFPILGFIVPWGLLSSFAWLGARFF